VVSPSADLPTARLRIPPSITVGGVLVFSLGAYEILYGDVTLGTLVAFVGSEAAFDLALRLERTPAAQKAGLHVWIDQRDLVRGRGWQKQLEEVIEKRSTVFAVLMGTRGVVNGLRLRSGLHSHERPETPATPLSRS
jgi:hypothetical protein